jgi:RNA polymerase sigma-70 factor (ECF subfamily)
VAVFDAEVRGTALVRDEMRDLEQVFTEYAPSIFHFFSNRGFSHEDCRDLTQDTFVKALRGIETFRGDAKLETWLLRIAANVWKNRIRSIRTAKRDARTTSLEQAMEQGDAAGAAVPVTGAATPDPRDAMLALERRRKLREAVGRLPERMQRCVTLRIDRGLKYREIAVIMQISIDTVKTQLYQARHRLKDDLQEYFDPEDLRE